MDEPQLHPLPGREPAVDRPAAGDEVARGIIEATKRSGIDLPMVVRLDGTNSDEGLALLSESGIDNLHYEKTMLGAAEKVVELAGGSGE